MLTATFIHAPGVGLSTEKRLWLQGATSWAAFEERVDALTVSRRMRDELRRTLDASAKALEMRDTAYFTRALATRWHWRALSEFKRVGFLDIETDGGFESNSITVIGLSDGFETRIYLKGRDLDQFAADCCEFDAFVTFFGAGFDIPFLKRRFPNTVPIFESRLHVDLCPALRSLGYTGGLKRIEHTLGIRRVPETEGLDGMDAVRLWQAYRRGGSGADDALRLLMAYNREDVENMRTLLEFALPRLAAETGFPVSDLGLLPA